MAAVAAFGQFATPILRLYPTFDDPLKASLGDVLLRLSEVYRKKYSSARKLALHHEDAMLFSCPDARFCKKVARGHRQ